MGFANFILVVVFVWILIFTVEGLIPEFANFNTPLSLIIELITIPFSAIFASR